MDLEYHHQNPSENVHELNGIFTQHQDIMSYATKMGGQGLLMVELLPWFVTACGIYTGMFLAFFWTPKTHAGRSPRPKART